MCARNFFKIDVRLRKIFAVRSFALVEVGDGIEPQAVDAHLEPEIEDLFDHFVHSGVVEIQIGLMRIEAMPVIGLRDRIPRPVRRFEVLEDDARVLVFFRSYRSRRRTRVPASPAERDAIFGTTDFDRRCD